MDPLLRENETLKDDVDDLIVETALRARRTQDGVVELTGSSPTQEDLDGVVREIEFLTGMQVSILSEVNGLCFLMLLCHIQYSLVTQ